MTEQTQLTRTGEFTGLLKPDEAKPIFDEAMESLVIQILARQTPIGTNRVEIPVVTGKPGVRWVIESERKSFTSASLGTRAMKPHKIACITVASAEVVRVNPGDYIDTYKKQVAEAVAVVFGKAALYRDGPFDTHITQTQRFVVLGTSDKGMYGDLVIGLDLSLKAKKELNGFVFDTASETMFLNELDANKHPIFVLNEVIDAPAPVSVGRLLGRLARLTDTVENTTARTIGFGGDWSKCVWGVTSGLNYRISTEVAVAINGELVSAFEHNLAAIVAEAEFAWLCADSESFVAFKMKGQS